MTERPILFSGPMIRALLAGRKTMTRRIVTVPWKGARRAPPYEPYYVESNGKLLVMDEYGEYHDFVSYTRCLYGEPGDRLWVRETWAPDVPGCEAQGGISYRADHLDPQGDGPAHPMKWRPSIFMPRAACRLLLDVTAVRVERLQDITAADIAAEGILFANVVGARTEFAMLWDEINGRRASWASNPWVWCVSFKRAEARP